MSPTYRYVKVNGLDELKKKLQAIPIEMQTQGLAGQSLAPAAFALRDEAIKRAPVYSGLLQDNIIAYRDRNPRQVRANAHYSVRVRRIHISAKVKRLLKRVRRAGTYARVTQDPYYWRFVEYGTSRIPAQGFFHKAVDTVEPKMVGLVNDRLSKKLDSIIRKIGST